MSSYIGMFYFTVEEVGTGKKVNRLNYKESCVAATLFPITFDPPASFNIDGVLVQNGQRILVRAQSNEAENGIYVREGNKFIRATDADEWDELIMATTFVESGNTWKGTSWLLYVERGGVLGIDNIAVVFLATSKDMYFDVNNFERTGIANQNIYLKNENIILDNYSMVRVNQYGRVLYAGKLIHSEKIACDGINNTFTTMNNFQSGTLIVYLNGLRLIGGQDYMEISDNQFSLNNTPNNGDILCLDYILKMNY